MANCMTPHDPPVFVEVEVMLLNQPSLLSPDANMHMHSEAVHPQKNTVISIKTSLKPQRSALPPLVLTCSSLHLFSCWFLLSPAALSFFQADEDEVSVNINHSA